MLQVEVPPETSAYVPEGHETHVEDDVAPTAVETKPAAHRVHVDAPALTL
jgi:hypothetical protein